MITTAEVLKRTGLTSSKTLSRYAHQKLIPPAVNQVHPDGRGRAGFWPAWVVPRIQQIQERLARGKSLDEIAVELGCDWSGEERKWARKRPDIRKELARTESVVAKEQFASWVADACYDYFRNIGIERPGNVYQEIYDTAWSSQFAEKVMHLIHKGCSPVLVLANDGAKVVPDFVVSSALGNPSNVAAPLLVLPIREKFEEAFVNVDPEKPSEPTYAPAMLVSEKKGKTKRLRKYKHTSQWDYSLEK